MANMAGNRSIMRASGQWNRCWLTVIKGELKLEASVTATPTYPVTNLSIGSITSGGSGAVKAGMRVMIYRSNGTDLKGQTRVRYTGTINNTNIPTREFSRGSIRIVSGDIIRIYDDIRLDQKVVENSADFDPDGVAYSAQGSNPPPLACSGGHWAGWDTMLPIATAGGDSDVVDPDSTPGNVSHTWTLPSGLSFASGNSSSANPTITGDPGEYMVTHVVTDDDNSVTVTQYVKYTIHDTNDPPYDCMITRLDADEAAGWSAGVRILGASLAVGAIPDGSLAILWKQEYGVTGLRASFGSDVSGRSHILMMGYIRREYADADSDGVERLEFEIISPLARLDELTGYSKVMLSEASPDVWREMKALSTKRAKTQIIQFYTNLIEAGWDLVYHSTYTEYTYPRFYLQRSTPLAQIRELADGVDARLVCRRNGRFEIHTHPKYIPITDRSGITVTLTLEDDDVLTWSATREHWRPIDIVEGRALTDGSDPQPIFSRWPGIAPGDGNQNVIIERLIADDQSDLNDRIGRRGADLDGVFEASNTRVERAVDLELTLWGTYDVFDFFCEYIKLDWVTARREIDLDNHLFVLTGASLEFNERGMGYTRLRLRTACNAANGATYRPPAEDENGLPDFDPPDVDFPDGGFDISFPGAASLEGAKLYKGTQRIAVIYRQGFALTTVFGSGMATAYTLYDHTLSPFSMTGDIVAWIPDGFAPGKGLVLTVSHAYYVDFNALTAIDKLTFSAASAAWGGDASFKQQNHFVLTNGNIAYVTTDNSTYTQRDSDDGLASAGSALVRTAPAYVSSHQDDYAVLPNRTSASNMQAYESDDAGVTWALLSNPLISSTSAAVESLHYPWHDNGGDTLAYYSQSSGGNPVLLRDNSGSPDTITPSMTAGNTAFLSRGGIGTYVGNRRRGVVAKFGTTDEVWVTDNFHAASPTYTRISSADYNRAFFAGDNLSTIYLVAFDSGKVALSTDGGVTIIEQTGNILTDQPTWDDAIAVAGY